MSHAPPVRVARGTGDRAERIERRPVHGLGVLAGQLEELLANRAGLSKACGRAPIPFPGEVEHAFAQGLSISKPADVCKVQSITPKLQ